MEILKEKNYELFKFIDSNRNLNRNHINKLKDSISKNGYIENCPIIVNKNMEVLDGQHRFVALKEMGLEIPYTISDTTKNKILIDLNILQKKWTVLDYVHYYATEEQNKYYIKLQELIKETGFDVTTILTAMNNVPIGGYYTQAVKEGNFTINPIQETAVRIFHKHAKELSNLLRIKMNTRFYKALIDLIRLENFKWNILLDRALNYPTKAYNCTTQEEAREMLKNLYNYRTNTKHKLK